MRTAFVIFSLLLAASAQQPQPKPNIAQANAQKARQMVEKCIQALGGSAYLNIKDLEQRGRGYGFYQNTPQGAGTVYVRMYRYPDKERYEFTKQRDWVIIHNGDKGYEITYRGNKDENAADLATYLRRRNYALDFVLREWIHQEGVAFFYEGTAIVGPKSAHQVTIMNARNEGVTLFIDADSLLPVKKSYSWRDPTSREMDTEEELYDEYRVEQGVNTPHVITRMKNGQITSQRFITTVTYNSGISDSLFAAPAMNYDKMKK